MTTRRHAGAPGHLLIDVSLAGTVAFAAAILPAAAGADAFQVPAIAVSLALFALSLPLAFYALATMALRIARQEDRITVGGLFFLQGSAPRPVRLALLGSLAASVAICVVCASRVPFGILQPVFPLSLAAGWGARYGTFPRLPDPPR